MIPKWIAFDVSKNFVARFDTKEQAAKEAEKWLGLYYTEPLVTDDAPWPWGMEGVVGYAEVKAVSVAVGPKTTDYRIIEVEQPTEARKPCH